MIIACGEVKRGGGVTASHPCACNNNTKGMRCRVLMALLVWSNPGVAPLLLDVEASPISVLLEQVEELRRRAGKLRGAASRCRERIASGELSHCTVRVTFRDNEAISIEAAEAFAVQLDEEAERLAGQIQAETAQPIATHSNWMGLDEAGLASELVNLLPQEAATAQAVLDQLNSEDRDDVAYAMLTQLSEQSLAAIAKDPMGKVLLKRLVQELNSGTISDEEIRQVQRVITHASATHGRLVTEALRPEVQRALQNAGATLQPISSGFAGLNFDGYSIVIEQMPPGVTPEAFLAELLKDPNATVNHPVFNLTSEFARRVPSGEPELGDIYEIDIVGPDNGDVVLNDKTPSQFTFTTIHTGWSGHGEHPEYGNREFGFERNPDGSITFYTRGASRPAGVPERVVGPLLQQATWTALIQGISNTIEARGGTARPDSFAFHQDPFRQ